MGHFDDVINKDELLHLSKDNLIKYITDCDLNVKSEDEACTAIMKWLEYDSNNRIKDFKEVLCCLRLDQLSPEYINLTLLEHSLLNKTRSVETNEISQFLNEVLHHVLYGKSMPELYKPLSPRSCHYCKLLQRFVIFEGSCNYSSFTVGHFSGNKREVQLEFSVNLNNSLLNVDPFTAVVDNYVFTTTKFSLKKFDMASGSLINCLSKNLMWVLFKACNKEVYALQYNHYNDIECIMKYDIRQNSYIKILDLSDLNVRIFDIDAFSAVSHKNYVFFFGIGDELTDLGSRQILAVNLQSRKKDVIHTELPVIYQQMRAILYRSYIIVVGKERSCDNLVWKKISVIDLIEEFENQIPSSSYNPLTDMLEEKEKTL